MVSGRVFDAWGVTDYHLLNPVDATGRAPLPGTQGGPRYMLKFPDGMWRYASFCGISGPPWFRCEWQPWAGKDGRHAELRRDSRQRDKADCGRHRLVVAQ